MAGSSLALALAAAEGVSRLAGPVDYRAPPTAAGADVWRRQLHRRSPVPGLGYELRPGMAMHAQGAWIETNSTGQRDRESPAAKPPGVFRIAVLGDSATFGFGVEGDQTYANVLERLLNDEPGAAARYDVVNFGVGGYSTRDEALVLAHVAMRWQPDLVLVGYVFNDPEIDPIQPLHSHFAAPSWWQHSHLLRRLAQALRGLEVSRWGDGDYLRYLHAEPRKWGSVPQALADMRATLSRALRPVPAAVVVFPDIPLERWEGYPYAALHEQVAQAASERGFQVIDLRAAFAAHAPAALRVSREDGHPNELGHEVAARAIWVALRQAGALPR